MKIFYRILVHEKLFYFFIAWKRRSHPEVFCEKMEILQNSQKNML